MKYFIITLFWLTSVAGFSQDVVTAEFLTGKKAFETIDGQTVSEFKLLANEDQLRKAEEEAAKYFAYLEFTAKASDSGSYDCSMVFLNASHHAAVHKMLLAMGVEKFIYEGQTYSIDQWFHVFKM